MVRIIKENLICPGLGDHSAMESGLWKQAVVGAEVGVWRGQLSLALMGHFPGLTMYLVDPYIVFGDDSAYVKTNRQTKFAAQDDYDRLFTCLEAYAAGFAGKRAKFVRSTSREAAKNFPSKILDFVFIDAGHTYEEVKEDIALWYPKVRDGGIVAGHDYGGRSDRRGVWGVKRAVDEMAAEKNKIITVGGGHVRWAVR